MFHRVIQSIVLKKINPLHLLFFCTGVSIIFHIWFSLQIQLPLIPTDEWSYKSMALSFFQTGKFYGFTPLFPNVFYQWCISWLFYFGEHFFLLVKICNILVLHSMVIPIYLIGRKYLSQVATMYSCLFVLLLPQMYYAHFVMIESLYFPLFWWVIYFFLNSFQQRAYAFTILSGCSVALLIHTKLNGLVPMIAYICTAIFISFVERVWDVQMWSWKPMMKKVIFFCLSTLTSYIVLSFLLKGTIDFSIGLYATLAKPENIENPSLWKIGALARNQLSLLALIYIIPLFSLIWGFLYSIKHKSKDLFIFTTLIIITLIGLLALVLKFVSDIDWLEHMSRIHSRYNTMIYPALLLSLFIFFPMIDWTQRKRYFIIGSFLLVIFVSFIFAIPQNGLNGLVLIDNPDISWLLYLDNFWRYLALGGMFLFSVCYCMMSKKRLLPLSVLYILFFYSIAHFGEARAILLSDAQNMNGQAKNGKEISVLLQNKKGTIVIADDTISMSRTLAYWLLENKVIFYQNSSNKILHKTDLPKDTSTIVVNPPYQYTDQSIETTEVDKIKIFTTITQQQ